MYRKLQATFLTIGIISALALIIMVLQVSDTEPLTNIQVTRVVIGGAILGLSTIGMVVFQILEAKQINREWMSLGKNNAHEV